jgi:hypothetical protein
MYESREQREDLRRVVVGSAVAECEPHWTV